MKQGGKNEQNTETVFKVSVRAEPGGVYRSSSTQIGAVPHLSVITIVSR